MTDQGKFRCATCRFAHHWAETRYRETRKPSTGLLARFRPDAWERTPYEAEGIQCLRYPEPMDTEADHWCGEYAFPRGADIRAA